MILDYTGIISENSGKGNHFIRNNDFNKLCTGCLAIGANSDGVSNNLSQGLVYQCNNFEKNGDDISVAANSNIRFLQSGGLITEATGNTFLRSKTNISYREQNYFLTYKYRFNIHNQYPSYVHNPFGNVWLAGVRIDNCMGYGYVGNAYYIEILPSLGYLENRYVNLKGIFETVPMNRSGNDINWEDPEVIAIVEQLDGDILPNGDIIITINGRPPITDLEKQIASYYRLTHLKQTTDAICYKALEILGSDTTGLDITEYRKWVGRFNTIESEYLLADICLELKEFAQAIMILDSMPIKFPNLDMAAHQNYWDYMAVVQEYSTLGDSVAMPPHLVNELVRLSNNNDFVAIKAYSFGEIVVAGWTELYPREFEPHPACVCNNEGGDLPPNIDKGGGKGKKNLEGNENIEEKIINGIKIYPNPTTGELLVDNGELTIKSVEIYDIVGKLQQLEIKKLVKEQ
jgi:hypothetical protein